GAAVVRPRRSSAARRGPASASESFNGAAVVRPRRFRQTNAAATPPMALQWGRGRSTAEITAREELEEAVRSLQWGRGRSTAEMRADLHEPGENLRASMGPRSFDRGDRMRPNLLLPKQMPAAFREVRLGHHGKARLQRFVAVTSSNHIAWN